MVHFNMKVAQIRISSDQATCANVDNGNCRGRESVQTMKGYGEVRILTLVLDGCRRSTSRPGRPTPQEETRYALKRGAGGCV